jgi:hypothetical protein
MCLGCSVGQKGRLGVSASLRLGDEFPRLILCNSVVTGLIVNLQKILVHVGDGLSTDARASGVGHPYFSDVASTDCDALAGASIVVPFTVFVAVETSALILENGKDESSPE